MLKLLFAQLNSIWGEGRDYEIASTVQNKKEVQSWKGVAEFESQEEAEYVKEK